MKTRLYIIATLTVLLLTACGKKNDENVVRIAYLPITHALPLAGLEKADGVKVELVKYGSWPELLDALNTGRVDAASVLIELAMKAKAQGIGLTAVALGHTDGNVIVVTQDVNSAKDLKGKTFAIPHRASSHHILLQEALAKDGLTIDDVNVVEMAPPEMPSALANKQIAGYCVAEPFGAAGVLTSKGKVLYRSDELWHESICCGLVVNDKAYKEKKALIDKVITLYEKQGKELSDKEVALSKAKTLLTQGEEVLRQSLQWINYANLKIKKEAYDDLSEKVKKYGIIDNPPTFEDFVK
ncbi:MAG: ABC transporter substrate-binding protein [Prevotella sp.]|jgi:NitT/TauT family transport system substrate-binding protein|nr:ABC transporter substrate-binding protein [Prevotella sp.]MCR5779992.1 ABC transporter substrate-binding protein [Bacteroidaceae bacterium]